MPTEQCHATISEVAKCFLETGLDKASAAVATLMISLPVWHSTLKDISDNAALIVPILGAIWLCVQIYAKIGEIRARKCVVDRDE